MSREIKFRAWDGKHMDYDYRDASLWNGLLVAEGDTILMQFTGLKDRNGKEIYEGDILYHDDIRRWPKSVHTSTAKRIAKYPRAPIVVEWMKDQAGFEPWVSVDYESTTGYFSDEIEIVGNIYENPELAEVQKDELK